MRRNILITTLMLTVLMVQPAAAEYVTAESGLRLREKPSLDAEIVKVVPFAEEVSGEIDGEWLKTENGYMKAEYLSDEDPLSGWTFMGNWHLTAYYETGYKTASGVYPEVGTSLAHNSLPFGTEVYVEGYGIWLVQDRGPSSMGNAWADLYLGDYGECVRFGSQYANIWIKEKP